MKMTPPPSVSFMLDAEVALTAPDYELTDMPSYWRLGVRMAEGIADFKPGHLQRKLITQSIEVETGILLFISCPRAAALADWKCQPIRQYRESPTAVASDDVF